MQIFKKISSKKEDFIVYCIKQGENEWIVPDFQVVCQNQVAKLKATTEDGRDLSLFGSFSIEGCKPEKKPKKKPKKKHKKKKK